MSEHLRTKHFIITNTAKKYILTVTKFASFNNRNRKQKQSLIVIVIMGQTANIVATIFFYSVLSRSQINHFVITE